MKIQNMSAASYQLAQIRQHQQTAKKSISPLTKAAEAEKAASIAIDIVEYLMLEIQSLKGAHHG
ncbi:hypothetical protein [Vibrio sp. SCSIO 43137]|uniref:hypothetical protein n=1 Tax=Vibrio sp. SCSIO 43137 TaxID=3021011 RepID=UPI002306F7CD|nr:hypothetical protein [Vibrio sp. SCSIO 43137]WCE31103.1 hypothetical protein PK654_07515 [Vibrio sp. SCSIO 43137]